MKRMLIIGLILLASGCGDPEITPQPATRETESPAHGPWSGNHTRPKFIVDDEPPNAEEIFGVLPNDPRKPDKETGTKWLEGDYEVYRLQSEIRQELFKITQQRPADNVVESNCIDVLDRRVRALEAEIKKLKGKEKK